MTKTQDRILEGVFSGLLWLLPFAVIGTALYFGGVFAWGKLSAWFKSISDWSSGAKRDAPQYQTGPGATGPGTIVKGKNSAILPPDDSPPSVKDAPVSQSQPPASTPYADNQTIYTITDPPMWVLGDFSQ